MATGSVWIQVRWGPTGALVVVGPPLVPNVGGPELKSAHDMNAAFMKTIDTSFFLLSSSSIVAAAHYPGHKFAGPLAQGVLEPEIIVCCLLFW